ncbi:hypothetical protein KP509_28G001000 [Ceratopteris richardii]|uniref:Uncharacterized protein n=1 Tax=Ceratopteris richardii TaxID=49495 RepID=A0A8T2R8V2_CERRI|nr:hypothetical protein KP509_28G001000 [Ceratopteris richardii]
MAQSMDRTGTSSITVTVQRSPSPPPAIAEAPPAPQVITLRLRRKKKVTWKEGTIDNEFLNKRSSKKCCIFHKEKPFDEDGSDDEDEHDDHSCHEGGEGACNNPQSSNTNEVGCSHPDNSS